MTLEKRSPCKVNLLLNILGRRPDGFHELETVMQPVGWHDRLTFRRQGQGVVLTCNDARLPTDRRNLVYRAAVRFFEVAERPCGVLIHLEKRIPMEAGLGGGSGNAATTLSALNELFERPLSFEQLEGLAAELGSDVPFFLQDQPALATGRGEVIQPLAPFAALRGCALVLVHPGFGVPTAWAYQRLADYPDALQGQPGRARRLIEELRGDTLAGVGRQLYNSLEAPVLAKYPFLAVLKDFLSGAGAPSVLMSGSGSTVFAILPGLSEAEGVRDTVRRKFGACWVEAVAVSP